MIHGKMKCMEQEMEHKVDNMKDSAEAKVNEIENKIDNK